MNPKNFSRAPLVGLVAPSEAEATWEVLAHTEEELARFGVSLEKRVVAIPAEIQTYAREAAGRGVRVLIVGSADGRLPGALAAGTTLPVIRVPIPEVGDGEPLTLVWPMEETSGSPFATVAIGEAGARNAALLVVSFLALSDERIREAWGEFRRHQTASVLSATLPGTEG